MPTSKGKQKRDPFLSLPLKGQCESLGIPFEQLSIPRSVDGWTSSCESFKKPEPAAYKHFEGLGYSGTFCEGSAPLMIMKCASLNLLAKINIFNDRVDACLRYFEAQCTIHQARSGLIVDAIRSATADSIRNHFAEIKDKQLYSTLYPDMAIDGLLSIWSSLGPDGWAKVAESFMKDPYTFRAGWPDLTLAAGPALKLVEVKTTDKLHASQKTAIADFLLPLGLSVSVVKLVPL